MNRVKPNNGQSGLLGERRHEDRMCITNSECGKNMQAQQMRESGRRGAGCTGLEEPWGLCGGGMPAGAQSDLRAEVQSNHPWVESKPSLKLN